MKTLATKLGFVLPQLLLSLAIGACASEVDVDSTYSIDCSGGVEDLFVDSSFHEEAVRDINTAWIRAQGCHQLSEGDAALGGNIYVRFYDSTGQRVFEDGGAFDPGSVWAWADSSGVVRGAMALLAHTATLEIEVGGETRVLQSKDLMPASFAYELCSPVKPNNLYACVKYNENLNGVQNDDELHFRACAWEPDPAALRVVGTQWNTRYSAFTYRHQTAAEHLEVHGYFKLPDDLIQFETLSLEHDGEVLETMNTFSGDTPILPICPADIDSWMR